MCMHGDYTNPVTTLANRILGKIDFFYFIQFPFRFGQKLTIFTAAFLK